METLYKGSALEPYMRIAEAHASLSPCTRRQYAALIAYDDISENPLWIVENNNRQSRCCNNKCARESFKFNNGERVEVGAEVHAETAALIKSAKKGKVFLLSGNTSSGSLYGENVYPCHTCALNIKFAGYSHIYIRKDKDNIGAISIAEVIEYREREWEPDN